MAIIKALKALFIRRGGLTNRFVGQPPSSRFPRMPVVQRLEYRQWNALVSVHAILPLSGCFQLVPCGESNRGKPNQEFFSCMDRIPPSMFPRRLWYAKYVYRQSNLSVRPV